MRNGSSSAVLALVELTDAQQLKDRHGTSGFIDLRDVYLDRLKRWVRAKDQWRLLDNNQFCVILKDIGSEGELELAAAKLGRLFETPHYQFGRAVSLDVTAGFAQLENTRSDLKRATEQAGMALRQARKSAKLFDIYSPQCEQATKEETDLLARLEGALERGEFHLYYQPKVNSAFRSVIGAESLIRWHTSEREIITPDRFIQVAEQHDIIQPITWWALKSAIAMLARWPEQLSISVNITPTLLIQNEILSVISDALEIHGVAPNRLCLEMTENVMVENPTIILKQMERLSQLGVRISLDDFGTGFCSLAYFRDLPVDEIKIDKSFVMRMLDSDRDYAIVKAIIDLAHNFSMQVVAEGVETTPIAERLAEMGCDVLQGYVFDKPLPAHKFARGYGIKGIN